MSCKVRLSDLISIKHGFAFKGEFFKDYPTSYILTTPGNFAIGGGFKNDKYKYYDGSIPIDYVLKENDLIVTMTDLSKQADTLGYSALVPNISGATLLHNQRIGLIEFHSDKIDKIYLYFLLRSPSYRHHVVSSATGSTVKHTSPTKILSFEFELPELGVQKLIAKNLLALEQKITLNRQINQTLEAMAQALFKSWFVDFEPVKAKMAALASGGNDEDANLAAMSAISSKTTEQLLVLKTDNPAQYQQLYDTAVLFPSEMVESELGEVPKGWEVSEIGSIVNRLKSKKTYAKADVAPYGATPVFEQGAGILLGFHNDEASLKATKDDPLFIFGDHTCITHLSLSDFDISSNVIPLKGKSYPTIWVYYAVRGKQKFQEYRRHWSELVVKTTVTPTLDIAIKFSTVVTSIHLQMESLSRQNFDLTVLRDTLLPKLLAGELLVGALEDAD